MPYISHEYGKTYYLSKGRLGKRLPLIVLHGGPGGKHNSLTHFFDLARERKVYLYDQIGGGKSSPILKKQMKIQTFVRELEILLDHWNVSDFHLLGGSWGTVLALEYYLQKKGRGVRSLIFRSPLFSAKDWECDAEILIRTLPKQTQKVIRYCHEIGATDSRVYQDAMKLYYSKYVVRNSDVLKQIGKPKQDSGREVYEYMWGPSEFKPTGTLKNYEQVKSLSKIKVPTHLICGQYDESRPQTVRKYQTKIKNASLDIIQGASHSISHEKPKNLTRSVRKFLSLVET